jgi:hypothetical protein
MCDKLFRFVLRSRQCRMAQYLKAFPRDQTFTHPEVWGKSRTGRNDLQQEQQQQEQQEQQQQEQKKKRGDLPDINGGDAKIEIEGEKVTSEQSDSPQAPALLSERLMRRSQAVHRHLSAQPGLRESITPIGEYLFGLDIL